MDILRSKIEEEGFILVLRNKLSSLGDKFIGHGFVIPKRGLSAGHIANMADSVDHTVIVAMGA